MFKSSHAARLVLPLFISLGGTAYGQLRPRPQSPPINTTPVVTQPLSKTKHNVTVDPSLTSAPAEKMQKAFREVIGRDPELRGELSSVTKFVLKGVTYNCIPPSDIAEFGPPPKEKRKEWDCSRPIMDWLYDTPEGQAEYRAVYARVVKEVFGLDLNKFKLSGIKPGKFYLSGEVGHHVLLDHFRHRLYKSSSLIPTPLSAPSESHLMEQLREMLTG